MSLGQKVLENDPVMNCGSAAVAMTATTLRAASLSGLALSREDDEHVSSSHVFTVLFHPPGCSYFFPALASTTGTVCCISECSRHKNNPASLPAVAAAASSEYNHTDMSSSARRSFGIITTNTNHGEFQYVTRSIRSTERRSFNWLRSEPTHSFSLIKYNFLQSSCSLRFLH